jgi:hypothetical protein
MIYSYTEPNVYQFVLMVSGLMLKLTNVNLVTGLVKLVLVQQLMNVETVPLLFLDSHNLDTCTSVSLITTEDVLKNVHTDYSKIHILNNVPPVKNIIMNGVLIVMFTDVLNVLSQLIYI